MCYWFDVDAGAAGSTPIAGRCRVTADGRYVLFLNGIELGRGPVRSEAGLLRYDEYDLTGLLRPGGNVFAALVRHYGQPVAHWKPSQAVGDLGRGGFLLETTRIAGAAVVTDENWLVWTAGYGRTHQQRWGGPPQPEVVDARELPPGWPAPVAPAVTAAASGWQPATVCKPYGLAVHDHRPPAGPFFEIRPRPIAALRTRDVTAATTVGAGTGATSAAADPLAAFQADSASTATIGVDHQPAMSAGDAAMSLHSGQWVTMDTGQVVNARPVMDLQATPGAVVDLAAGEDLDTTGRPVIDPRRWTMRYISRGEASERIEAFEAVGFRYLSATVRSGVVTRLELSAREDTYPRSSTASFGCSDPFLSQLWAAGARTLDLCSSDAFVDCPGRENRAWLGDAYLHTLLTFVTNDDWRLARWNLSLHAQGCRPDGLLPMVAAGDLSELATTIPDYTLHWIRALARWWEYTGDVDLVRELLPTAVRGLQFFERHRGPDGRFAALPGWVFIDWAQTERSDHIAAADALFSVAASDLSTVAAAVGDAGTAGWAAERAALSREALVRYWDDERGVYVDAASLSGERSRRVSQQTNALAILAGAVPKGRLPRLVERILDEDRLVTTRTPGDHTPDDRLTHQWRAPSDFDERENVVRAQPFFAHFLHEALAREGYAGRLPALLRRWRPLLARGNGCLEEYWSAPPGRGSRAHAWSATPTYDLTRHVLGVSPAAPGTGALRLRPALGDLEWVEGVVPTNRGPVSIRAARTDVAGRTRIEHIDIPDQVTVELETEHGPTELSTGRHRAIVAVSGLPTEYESGWEQA